MQVGLTSPVEKMAGSDGNPTGAVYAWRRAHQISRRNVVERVTQSRDQLLVRALLAQYSRAFSHMSDEEREAWAYYAANLYPVKPGMVGKPDAKAAFVSVQIYRYFYGLGFDFAAPTRGVNWTVTKLDVFQYHRTFQRPAIEIEHTADPDAGQHIFVRLGYPLPKPQRRSRENERRCWAETDDQNVRDVEASPMWSMPVKARHPLAVTTGDWWVDVEITPLTEEFAPDLPLVFHSKIVFC
jgi:hypothetical protein